MPILASAELNAHCRTRSEPPQPGQGLQRFDTEIVSLVGQLSGDLDFDSLTLVAGVNEDPALQSPPETTLTIDGGEFAVDSFFDVNYSVAFVGAVGGDLDGLNGYDDRRALDGDSGGEGGAGGVGVGLCGAERGADGCWCDAGAPAEASYVERSSSG
jgi:hypothetical protein